jgi:superfamily II DNA or RNA helicase
MIQFRSHQSRALDILRDAQKGCVYVPTGGGKTLIMMEDCKRRLQSADTPQTIIVVAPRILLAVQLYHEFLEYLDDDIVAAYMHVHSGDVNCYNTTKPADIAVHTGICLAANSHQLIFTTYHSLPRVVDSGIDVDVLYCDEAHNATNKQHFVGVAATSTSADNAFFFTATPKYSRDPYARGMNNRLVFGDTLMSVPAPELVENGSIIPPQLVVHETEHVRTKHNAADVDRDVVLDIIEDLDEQQSAKVLVAAPNTRVLWRMLSNSDIIECLRERGYDILHITSKHGAYVNQTKVSRDVFFNTLTEWGRDDDKKFIIFHYSILSEGINVPGLTHTILLRNLPVIEMAQTIGRVIRLHKDDAKDIADGKIPAGQYNLYRKSHGVVTVPIHGKQSIATRNRLQKVIDLIFVDGLPAHSFA